MESETGNIEDDRKWRKGEMKGVESKSAPARGSTAVLEDNKHLRHLLFLQHGGAGHMIYGDDGERQCNSCLIDFNKDTVAQIERRTFEYNVKQYEQQWPQKDKQ